MGGVIALEEERDRAGAFAFGGALHGPDAINVVRCGTGLDKVTTEKYARGFRSRLRCCGERYGSPRRWTQPRGRSGDAHLVGTISNPRMSAVASLRGLSQQGIWRGGCNDP